ncbi:MAG: N-acetylmuramoyl-L-alanine amidase [Cellulosilyticaceae bacterium]
MKKYLFLIITLVVFSMGMTKTQATPLELVYDGSTHVYDLAPITLYIEDTLVETYAMPPVQIEEVTLVPIREVFEPMGAFVEWKEGEKKAYIAYQDTLIVLEMNNPEVWLNGETFALDLPAKTINNKIMVPVRFISEQLGFEVRWDGGSRTIRINSPIETLPEIEESEETEDKQEDSDVEVSEADIRYERGETKLFIGLGEQVLGDQITIQNDYIGKKITIDLGGYYGDTFNDSELMIKDAVIAYIEINNTLTTQIILHMNGIYEHELEIQADQLAIQLIKPRDKYDKILFLDAGHGGKAPGSVSNNLIEKEVNLKQTLAVRDLIENNTDIKVYLTRTDDRSVSTEERPFIANEIGADLFVSIHNNSIDRPEINGTEVLYYPDTIGSENKSIAEIFQEKIVAYGGLKDRGTRPDPELWVLKMTHMPAVLIEGGFLSNAEDAFCLGSEAFTMAYAYAVYEAIVEFFNHF